LAANPPRLVVLDHMGSVPQSVMRPGDLTLGQVEASASASAFSAVSRSPNDESILLFSSGTTGTPKAIPWLQTTPIRAVSDAYYHFDMTQDDTVCLPTSLGWMMGAWHIYSSLVTGGTMAMFNGAPAGDEFMSFVDDHATILGMVPAMAKTWLDAGSMDGHAFEQLRLVLSTGESSNPVDYRKFMDATGYRVPITEYCGGTELGGGYVASTVTKPMALSTFNTYTLGTEAVLVTGKDDNGVAILAEEGEPGEIFIKPPSVGLSERLANVDKSHDDEYYNNCPVHPDGSVLRRHGDGVAQVAGLLKSMGRTDDAMNLGGIKVGATDIEATVDQLEGVEKAVAISATAVFDMLAHVFSETDAFRSAIGALPRVMICQKSSADSALNSSV
jgi:acetyl-CoA synthetase